MKRLTIVMLLLGIMGGAGQLLIAESDNPFRAFLFIAEVNADEDDDDDGDDGDDDDGLDDELNDDFAVGSDDDIGIDDVSDMVEVSEATDGAGSPGGRGDDDDEDWGGDVELTFEAGDDSVDGLDQALDHQGYIVRTAEILAINAEDTSLELIEALGFAVLRQQNLAALSISLAVIETPAGVSVRDAIKQLREHDSQALYEFNHLYSAMRAEDDLMRAESLSNVAAQNAAEIVIGLIDTAVATEHRALRNSDVISRRFVDGSALPMVHGTSIASLLVGESKDFQSLLPGATLYSAAVFDRHSSGRISASADSLAAALNWLVKEEVAVINMSLAGPPNVLLEMAVRKSLGLGHGVVAAVGNDGPAAPPLYPAAYPGVVAVTAVDAKQRVYRRANRGDYVDFSALGVNVRAADQQDRVGLFSGTSYAVPVVSAMLARRLIIPDVVQQQAALVQLQQQATDIGLGGRDSIFGYGLLSDSRHDD